MCFKMDQGGFLSEFPLFFLCFFLLLLSSGKSLIYDASRFLVGRADGGLCDLLPVCLSDKEPDDGATDQCDKD